LRHMNPPAIEIYAEHNIDLHQEPLEIAVCHQHCNGGMAVDRWWRSPEFDNVYVVGELAGTHGVKRPGGSALNAGQVGGLRAAQHITHTASPSSCLTTLTDAEKETIATICASFTAKRGSADPAKYLARLQSIMDQCGGFLRSEATARKGIAELTAMHRTVEQDGWAVGDQSQVVTAVRTHHLLITGLAVLESILESITGGAGSRGSHLVLDGCGEALHPSLTDDAGKPLTALPEKVDLRDRIVSAAYDKTQRQVVARLIPVRRVTLSPKAFETAWREFRDGEIYS
jgi:succinate dehydrogenase/fumarate reductase flavoprotein subunit